MRPEIVIPLTEQGIARDSESVFTQGYLDIGKPVRIIRDPLISDSSDRSSALPSELRVLASGSKARVLEVKLESGEACGHSARKRGIN